MRVRALLPATVFLILDDSLPPSNANRGAHSTGLRGIMEAVTNDSDFAPYLDGPGTRPDRCLIGGAMPSAVARRTARARRLLRGFVSENIAGRRARTRMSNLHEEEALGKAYDSRLMRRLLQYMKP